MEQLSFAPGNAIPQHPDHSMFTAYETKFIKGRMVKVPLGCIKKRLQKEMEKLGPNFYRLDQAKLKRKALKKGSKE